MIVSRVELKENAKKSLKGNWGQAILVLVILGLISLAVSCIGFFGNNVNLNDPKTIQAILDGTTSVISPTQVISYVLSILVSAFLTLGSVSFYMKLSRNEKVTYKELFSKTSLWLLYIGVSIMTAIFIGLWSLLLIIPGIIASYKYSMVNYIMVDNPEIGVFEAIRKSKEMMYGHKLDYFVLHLSFIGWALLAGLTFGILLLYVIPYMNTTCANFYYSIKDEKAKN